MTRIISESDTLSIEEEAMSGRKYYSVVLKPGEGQEVVFDCANLVHAHVLASSLERCSYIYTRYPQKETAPAGLFCEIKVREIFDESEWPPV